MTEKPLPSAGPDGEPAAAPRDRRLPPRWAPVVFGFLLSGMMTLIVSGISTARVQGSAFEVATWLTSWIGSWVVAFPIVLFVAPLVRRLVARVVRPASSP